MIVKEVKQLAQVQAPFQTRMWTLFFVFWDIPVPEALRSHVIFIAYNCGNTVFFALIFAIILWGLSLRIILAVTYFAEFFV